MVDGSHRISHTCNSSILIRISAVILISAIVSCSSLTGQSPEPTVDNESGDILDIKYRVAKYSAYLDEISEQMIDDFAGTVISDYGKILAGHRTMTADELTVDNELFWTSFIAANYIVPPVICSRVLLLMKEGRLDQASNTMAFARSTAFTMTDQYESGYAKYLSETSGDLEIIFQYINEIYYAGVSLSQAGDWKAAIEKFDEALAEYPDSCPSQNGKAITLLRWGMAEMDVEMLEKSGILMDAARADNPFYGWAYHNHPDRDQIQPFVINEVSPTLLAVGNWRSVDQVDPGILEIFAADCLVLDAPEYALYALIYIVDIAIQQFVENGHITDIDIGSISEEAASILEDMGMPSSAEISLMAIPGLFN